MNKIIAISREFGSGGKEIGKRLFDILGKRKLQYLYKYNWCRNQKYSTRTGRIYK